MEIPLGEVLETVQRWIAALVAASPVGEGLRLVGGFRYRLLDGSSRASLDIDYHWDGDLEQKRDEVLALLRKKLLPEVRRRLAYDGSVEPLVGPDAESPTVKTVALAIHKLDVPGSRIELPVGVTRVACLDAPLVRTMRGTVYLTASDADMAESKVLALLERTFVQDRDLLDLYLFRDTLPPDARARLKKKLSMLAVSSNKVTKRLLSLREDKAVRARGVDRIIRDQVDRPAAANLKAAGGGKVICQSVLEVLDNLLGKARR